MATPLLGLQQAEEAGLLQCLHRFVGDAPQVLGFLCALAQRRQQCFDPFGHFLRHRGTCSCLVGLVTGTHLPLRLEQVLISVENG